MKTKRGLSLLLVLIVGLIYNSTLLAASSTKSDAMYKMAEIMLRLKHFPSPAGKETLQGIIDNKATSKNQRILATAMINLQHKAVGADVPKLKALMEDSTASQDERDLAKILYELDHRPTKENKQRLDKMLKDNSG